MRFFDKYNVPSSGIRVLLVDADLTCLVLVSKMLRILGYEVMTAAQAYDALSIIQKNTIHLVLMDIHLPDMKMFGLIEIIRECYGLPSFIMSADDDELSMKMALCKGAKLYFTKPVEISDLRILWQFAMWNIEGKPRASEAAPQVVIANKVEDSQPPKNKGKRSVRSAEGKGKEPLDVKKEEEEDEEEEENEAPTKRRKRISWTRDLHNKFMEAVKSAGGKATAKVVHALMDAPGVTKQNVASYLQKHRHALRQQAKELIQHTNEQPSDPNFGSQELPPDYIPNMDMELVGTTSQFPSLQNIPSIEDSTSSQNQLCLQKTVQGISHGTSSGFGELNWNGNGSVFNEGTILNSESFFNEGVFLSACGSFSNEGALVSSGSVVNEGALPSNRNALNEGAILSNQNVFNEDALLTSTGYGATTKPYLNGCNPPLGSNNSSYVGYTADENEMQTIDNYQQLPQQLPVQPAPSYEKKPGFFDVEAPNIDEIFNNNSTGNEVFYDEDFGTWLERV